MKVRVNLGNLRSHRNVVTQMPFYPRLFWRGRSGLVELDRGNITAAVALFQRLAGEGDSEAQYQIGLLCEAGLGAKTDNDTASDWIVRAAKQRHWRALRWLQRAAANNIIQAQFELATMYRYGEGAKHSPRRAQKLMRRAAEFGLAEAQVEFALMYYYRLLYPSWTQLILSRFRAVPDRNAKALPWFRLAAQQGNAKGKLFIALHYAESSNIQDYDTALQLLREAAEQELEAAQLYLAKYLWTGRLGRQDRAESMRWFEKGCTEASSRSDSGVALMLADAFAEGWCVEQDPVKECYWTAIVWRRNPAMRNANLKSLYKSMDSAQVDRAKELIKSELG